MTLDILLIDDPNSGMDRTGEWESQLDHRSGPKLKFPVKIREESFGSVDVSFDDPNVSNPVKKKGEIEKKPKVVEIGKKKRDNKSKLF